MNSFCTCTAIDVLPGASLAIAMPDDRRALHHLADRLREAVDPRPGSCATHMAEPESGAYR